MMDTSAFAAGLARGVILYQACERCGAAQTLARLACTQCGRADPAWREAAGRGTLYAVTRVYRAPDEAFRALAPYRIALVDMDEGFRLMGQLADEAAIGDPVMARIVTGGIGEPLVMFSRAVSREA